MADRRTSKIAKDVRVITNGSGAFWDNPSTFTDIILYRLDTKKFYESNGSSWEITAFDVDFVSSDAEAAAYDTTLAKLLVKEEPFQLYTRTTTFNSVTTWTTNVSKQLTDITRLGWFSRDETKAYGNDSSGTTTFQYTLDETGVPETGLTADSGSSSLGKLIAFSTNDDGSQILAVRNADPDAIRILTPNVNNSIYDGFSADTTWQADTELGVAVTSVDSIDFNSDQTKALITFTDGSNIYLAELTLGTAGDFASHTSITISGVIDTTSGGQPSIGSIYLDDEQVLHSRTNRSSKRLDISDGVDNFTTIESATYAGDPTSFSPAFKGSLSLLSSGVLYIASDGSTFPYAVAKENVTSLSFLPKLGDQELLNNLGSAAFLNVPVSGNAATDEVVRGDDTRITSLGTASTFDVPSSGDAAAGEVVLGNDSRLTGGGGGSGSGSGVVWESITITNGDFETGDATGWTTDIGSVRIEDWNALPITLAGVSPARQATLGTYVYDGGRTSGGGGQPEVSSYQDIDVSSDTTSIAFKLEADLGSDFTSDFGYLELTLFDVDNNELEKLRVEGPNVDDVIAKKNVVIFSNPDQETLRVRIGCFREAGTDNNGFVDNVTLFRLVSQSSSNYELLDSSVSSTYDAVAGDFVDVDTTTSNSTVNLPASPNKNDEVSVRDGAMNFATNSCTINRNGSNIQGSATNLILNTNDAEVSLIYSGNASRGWVIKRQK